jgi:GNAT superfamily N-acetyltransferase
VVEDRWQRRGLGTLLLQALVDHARARGIDAFQATVHQANTRILRFIRRSGLPTRDRVEGGLWEVRVSLKEE